MDDADGDDNKPVTIGSMWQCERQCVAVRTAAVCGSVRHYAAVQKCAAVRQRPAAVR
jgi:hypothetical protein